MKKKECISIVIPCFNEEEALPVYYKEMELIMEGMDAVQFELIFVDDGSSDRTLEIMKELNRRDSRCRYLSFSRNFGKEAAIYAGLTEAVGDYGVIMDVDLQDPPRLLPEMYRILQEEDYDCVAARRVDRAGEPGLRSYLADRFYGWMSRLSGMKMVKGARDFRLMKRKMLDAVLEFGECGRFTKGIFEWVGFPTRWLEYENVERAAGETKWSLWKLAIYAVEGITAFSTAPLLFALAAGLLFLGLAALTGCTGVLQLLGGQHPSGLVWIAALVFFVGGVQLFGNGISGWYLSKTYLEVKNRPVYIVRTSSNEQTAQEVEEKHSITEISEQKKIPDHIIPYLGKRGEAV